MTDTRPHFYFKNSEALRGDNIKEGDLYLIFEKNGMMYDYFDYEYFDTETTWTDPPDISKTYSIIKIEDKNEYRHDYDSKYYQINETYAITEYNGRLIGEISYPDGDLYEEEPVGSWSINGKDVKSLSINGKEIESIERISDGVILYKKPSISSNEPHNYNLTLYGDSIIDKDNTLPITALLTDNDVPVAGETVVLKNNNGVVLDSAVTDSNGEAVLDYVGTGAGDMSLSVECMSLTKTYVITDYYEIVNTSNPKGVTSQYYANPIQITGTTKKNGSWGGIRINGDNGILYVFLSQNSGNAHESEKIWYVIGYTLIDFKIEINNNSVSLFINDTLYQSVKVDTSGSTRLWGGSNANPVYLTDVRIKKL